MNAVAHHCFASDFPEGTRKAGLTKLQQQFGQAVQIGWPHFGQKLSRMLIAGKPVRGGPCRS